MKLLPNDFQDRIILGLVLILLGIVGMTSPKEFFTLVFSLGIVTILVSLLERLTNNKKEQDKE